MFLEILFGTWYKGGLFSIILCKQHGHMYDVELNSIKIWKHIESWIDNWYEKHLSFFLKHNISQLKHGIMCVFLYLYYVLFYLIEHHVLQKVVVWELDF